jgi:hypothetical protein
MRDIKLSMEPDRMIWCCTTDNQYFSKSCYNVLFEGALVMEVELEGLGACQGEIICLACFPYECWAAEWLACRGLLHPTY